MPEVFRPAHKVTRSKSQACWRCHATPVPSGRPFFICSGCKETVYCSVDCQNLDWKIHKWLQIFAIGQSLKSNLSFRPLCKFLREQVAPLIDFLDSHRSLFFPNDKFPPLTHRLNLLNNFIKAHAWYFEKTVHYAVRYLSMEEAFDF